MKIGHSTAAAPIRFHLCRSWGVCNIFAKGQMHSYFCVGDFNLGLRPLIHTSLIKSEGSDVTLHVLQVCVQGDCRAEWCHQVSFQYWHRRCCHLDTKYCWCQVLTWEVVHYLQVKIKGLIALCPLHARFAYKRNVLFQRFRSQQYIRETRRDGKKVHNTHEYLKESKSVPLKQHANENQHRYDHLKCA